MISTFASCATSPKHLDAIDTGASLFGMVYDSEKKAVSDCQVTIDDSQSATTDVNGRFLFDFVDYGDHKLVFHKTGCEDFVLNFAFSSKSQIVYARLTSQSGLFEATRAAIASREWDRATEFLARAEAIGDYEPLSSFLAATLAYRRGDVTGAERLILNLAAKDYKDATIYVFLADIYQYHLLDFAKAKRALQESLAIREDGDVRERLESLEKTMEESTGTNPSQ